MRLHCDAGADVVNITSSARTKTNDRLSGVLKGVGFYIKKGSMSEEEAEGSIQVEDTSEKENIEPPLKKAKTREDRKIDRLGKLEARLNDILSCTVCLDLPTKSVFQCRNGHLMCASCFTHLLADSRLKNEQSTCPNCRTEINRNICSRNLAVEKAISELPTECSHCSHELPRSCLKNHEDKECLNR